jgi:hypothetical protein
MYFKTTCILNVCYKMVCFSIDKYWLSNLFVCSIRENIIFDVPPHKILVTIISITAGNARCISKKWSWTYTCLPAYLLYGLVSRAAALSIQAGLNFQYC